MAIIRWRDLGDLHVLRREMDRMFDSYSRNVAEGGEEASSGWYPMVDITKTNDNFILSA